MHDMPQSVREDMSMEAWSSMASNVPFLTHVDNSFLRRLSLTTSTYMFAPGDIVLYAGDMGREMYSIRKGYVEVTYASIAWKEVLSGCMSMARSWFSDPLTGVRFIRPVLVVLKIKSVLSGMADWGMVRW